MNRLKSVCAVLLAVLMVVMCIPAAAETAKADTAKSVTISADEIGDIDAIKSDILTGLVGSGNVEDYEFYYEYSFDNLSKSSILTPAFVLDGEEVAEFFGDEAESLSTHAINQTATDGYAKLHNQFVNFAKSSSICKKLAAAEGVTTTELVNAIFPEGSEGQAKLQEIMAASYLTPIQGYDNINSDVDSDLTASACVAYIPYTVNGKEYTKSFGIALPEISAGTWEVTVVRKENGVPVTGTVTIEAKEADVSVTDGVTVAPEDVATVATADCDAITVYLNATVTASASTDVTEGTVNTIDAYIMLPESINDFEVTASYGAENFGEALHDQMVTYIENNLIERLRKSTSRFDTINFIVDELPSANGIYYVTVLTADRDYETAMATGVFAINDGTADDATLTFTTEATNDTLLTSDDFSAEGTDTIDYLYIGKDLDGNGNGLDVVLTELEKCFPDLTNSDPNYLRVTRVAESLASGELPENSAELVKEFIELYAPADDDNVATAFIAEVMDELSEGGFDLNDYGFYNNEEDVKAIGEGTYLEIAKDSTDAVAVPIMRVFELSDEEFAIDKTEETMKTEDTLQITATGVPSKLTVNWSSSDETVATVDETGLVTAKTYGKCTITAALSDGSDELTCEISTLYYDVAGNGNRGTKGYQYFFKPVYWAADNGITKGFDNVYYGVGKSCTRREVCIFLWRMAGCPTGYGDAAESFSDVKAFSTSTATNQAIAWAADQGIVKGYADGTFKPNAAITRKDCMIMIYRYAGKPDCEGGVGFEDVYAQKYPKTSDSFKSIAWGLYNNLIGGYDDGTFRPLDNCLREQVITFLYRYAIQNET